MYKLLFFVTLFVNLPSLDEAILFLSGAESLEELSEVEIERYYHFSEQKLSVNFSRKSQLLSSGLFSSFQVSSLLSYRSQSGNILSCEELSLVGGFDENRAKALSYFLDFNGSLNSSEQKTYHHNLSLSYKNDLKLKYKAQIHNSIEAYWSTKTDFSSQYKIGTVSAVYYGKSFLNKLIIGHFNSKFGQGLCSWTAFSLSGYSSVSSFIKNPSGFVSTGSYSANDYGICAEIGLWNLDFSLGYSLNNKDITANITWNTKTFSLGVTAKSNKASIDYKIGRPDLCFFSEIASSYKGEIAALSGVYYSPKYGEKYAIQLRYFDAIYKNYSGLALGMERSWLTATADFGYRIDKKIFQIKPLIILKNPYATIRYSMRYRNTEKMRNDLRLDLKYNFNSLIESSIRFNALYCNSLALLSYIQIGHKSDKYAIYLRATFFDIKSWEDRIYVYQQDAPGGFNVPAFNGKGISAYIYAYCNIKPKHTLYFRCEYRNKIEFQLQYRWKI